MKLIRKVEFSIFFTAKVASGGTLAENCAIFMERSFSEPTMALNSESFSGKISFKGSTDAL
jgi:hypothetical protein